MDLRLPKTVELTDIDLCRQLIRYMQIHISWPIERQTKTGAIYA